MCPYIYSFIPIISDGMAGVYFDKPPGRHDRDTAASATPIMAIASAEARPTPSQFPSPEQWTDMMTLLRLRMYQAVQDDLVAFPLVMTLAALMATLIILMWRTRYFRA